MDRESHQRYLDYRERHGYFGATTPVLGRDAFLAADAEYAALAAREGSLDEEEETRFAELAKLLFRD
jgi:hypothetical protein